MKRVRVVFCGEADVGKSSIIHRFSKNVFTNVSSTVAGAFHSACVKYDDSLVFLELWDTAGSERYHSVIPSFFKNASAIVIVYDVTKRDSFDRVGWWVEFTCANAPEDAETFLVGNKVDLFSEREVPFDEGQAFAEVEEFSAFIETSAKTGEEVETLFALLAESSGRGTVDAEVEGNVRVLTTPGCC
jgi:small GTP-binding protein